MPTKIVSFGFKHGTPEGGTVVDVQGFINPFKNRSLRALNGLDYTVGQFIEEMPGFETRYKKLKQQVSSTPGVVYLGCLGGRHRSVFLAERLGKELQVPVLHRDLGCEAQKKSTREIFKLQKEVLGGKSVLIYNRDNSVMQQVPMTKALNGLFRDTVGKAFHYCHFENDKLVIDEVAPWQEW